MKTTLASFFVLAIAFTFLSFGIMAVADADWAVSNLDLSLGSSIAISVFASAGVNIIQEPKTKGSVVLPSNIL